ncbi:hypothetical protein FocnCong_v020893 [Fusarium oxysporum f. sp. conglutinans]|nr:hypothetical protein FocnCong_v020893 [Fusarium oxysporum f. sp. conglutinans]
MIAIHHMSKNCMERTPIMPTAVRCFGYQSGKCQYCTRRNEKCFFELKFSSNRTTVIPVSAFPGCFLPGTQLTGAYGQPLAPGTVPASSPPHPAHQHSTAPPPPTNYYAPVQSPTEPFSPYADARTDDGSQLAGRRCRRTSEEQDDAYRLPPPLSAVDNNPSRRSPAEFSNRSSPGGVGCPLYGGARQIPRNPTSGTLPQAATATTGSYAVSTPNGRSPTGHNGSSGASTPARQGKQSQGGNASIMGLSNLVDKSDIDKTMIDRLNRPAPVDAVAEPTPPPRPIASSLQQIPWLRNTSSFANSSEHRKYVEDVLKEELESMYVGVRHFHDAHFGGVAGLDAASQAFFKQCVEGSDPLFEDSWKGWPRDASQDDAATSQTQRINIDDDLCAQPNKSIQGSTGERKLDIGFVKDTSAGKDSRCRWSQNLVPGKLKSNPSADKASMTWLDLGRYAREVLVAHNTRRFVLSFTICGSLMRVWAFDRLGGIASEQFDINKDGRQFVSTILGFLWMNEEQLGFDSAIMTANGERFIEGSWQYPERDEEGELPREAAHKGVVNVAQYYHHETVQLDGADDDIRNNVRRGLDITQAANYRPERPIRRSNIVSGTSREGRSSTKASRKRSSSQAGAPLASSQRSCSVSSTRASSSLPNRVHRRVILQDYGMPIYKASSRSALLAAFERYIEGHES